MYFKYLQNCARNKEPLFYAYKNASFLPPMQVFRHHVVNYMMLQSQQINLQYVFHEAIKSMQTQERMCCGQLRALLPSHW